ncbi:hypothetical protein ABPG72_002790 [Tetrahymena utriculariae]
MSQQEQNNKKKNSLLLLQVYPARYPKNFTYNNQIIDYDFSIKNKKNLNRSIKKYSDNQRIYLHCFQSPEKLSIILDQFKEIFTNEQMNKLQLIIRDIYHEDLKGIELFEIIEFWSWLISQPDNLTLSQSFPKYATRFLSLQNIFEKYCHTFQNHDQQDHGYLKDINCILFTGPYSVRYLDKQNKINYQRNINIQNKLLLNQKFQSKLRNLVPSCGEDSCIDPYFNICTEINNKIVYYVGRQTNGICVQRNQFYSSIEMCASQHCIQNFNNSRWDGQAWVSYVQQSCLQLTQYNNVGYNISHYCLRVGQANAVQCIKGQFCLDQISSSCMQLSSNQIDNRFARQANTDFCISQYNATQTGDNIEQCVRGYCVYTDPVTNLQTCLEVGMKYQYCADKKGKCTFIYTNYCSYCPDGYCQFSGNYGYCIQGRDLFQKLGEKNCAVKVNDDGLCQILNINTQKYFIYDVCTDINGFCQKLQDRTQNCQQCPEIFRNPGNQICYSIEQTQQFLQLKLVFNMNLDYLQDDCYDQNNCLSNSLYKCPQGCFSCSSAYNCTQCQKGFFMYKNPQNNYNNCITCPYYYWYGNFIDCSSELDLWNQNQEFKTCRNYEWSGFYKYNRFQKMNDFAFNYRIIQYGNYYYAQFLFNCLQNCVSCQIQGLNNVICLSCQQGFALQSSICVPCPNKCIKCEYAIFVSGKKALLKSSLSQKQLSSGQYANVVWTLICLQCPVMQLVRYDLLSCEDCGYNCYKCVYQNIYGIVNDQQNNLIQMTQQDLITLGYQKVCKQCYQGIIDGSGQNCTQINYIPQCYSQTFLMNDSIYLNIFPLYYLQSQVTKFTQICNLCYNGYQLTPDKMNCTLAQNNVNFCGNLAFDVNYNRCLSQICQFVIYKCYQCFTYQQIWYSSFIQIYQCTQCAQGFVPTLKGCLPCPEGCSSCYEGSQLYSFTNDLAQNLYQFSYQNRLSYTLGVNQKILCTSCLQGYFLDSNTQQCVKLTCGKYCSNCYFDQNNNKPACQQCDTNALSNLIKDQQYWISRLYFNQNQLPNINQLIKFTEDGTDCMICPILCSTCLNVGDISKNPYFLYQSQCMSCINNLNGLSQNIIDYRITYDKSRRKCYLCKNQNQGCHYQKQKVIYAQCSNVGKPLGDGSLQNPINFNRIQDINIDQIILNELPFDQLAVYYNELQVREINVNIIFLNDYCEQQNSFQLSSQLGNQIFSLESLTLNITSQNFHNQQKFNLTQTQILKISGFNSIFISGIDFIQQKPFSNFGISIFSSKLLQIGFDFVSFKQISVQKDVTYFYLQFSQVQNTTIAIQNCNFQNIALQNQKSLITLDQFLSQEQSINFTLFNTTFDKKTNFTGQSQIILENSIDSLVLQQITIENCQFSIDQIQNYLIVSNIIQTDQILMSCNQINNFGLFNLVSNKNRQIQNQAYIKNIEFSNNQVSGNQSFLFQNDGTSVNSITVTKINIILRDNLNLQFVYIRDTNTISIDTLEYTQADEQNISQVSNTIVNIQNLILKNVTLISSKQATSMSFLQISTDRSIYISIKDIQYQIANFQSTISYVNFIFLFQKSSLYFLKIKQKVNLQQVSLFLNVKAFLSPVTLENALFTDISPFLIAPLLNINAQTAIFKQIYVQFNKFQLQIIKQDNQYKLGGTAYIQSVNTQILNSNITSSQAIQGAGIYLVILDFGNVLIRQSYFINNVSYMDNNSESFGGGIYFDGNQSYGFDITIEKSYFIENFASFRGGGIYLLTPFHYSCSLGIFNTYFNNNFSFQGSQIFVKGNLQDKTKLEINNIQLLNNLSQLLQQMIFLKAFLLYNKQYQNYIPSSIQTNNIQYFQLQQSKLSIQCGEPNLINKEQIIFQNILQVDGLNKFDCFLTKFENSIFDMSLISLKNINQTQFQYVTIQNNSNYYDYIKSTKQNNQNANLLQIFSNSVQVIYSNFTDNKCSVCQTGNVLIGSVKTYFSFSFFKKNIALNGGILYISSQKGISENSLRALQQTNQNKSSFLIYESYTIISKCQFEENQSIQDGGAIYLQQFPVIIQTSKFIQNAALQNGGAIYSDDKQNDYLESFNCLYQKNVALNGGAVYSVQGNSLQNQQTNKFAQNQASILNNDIFTSPCQMQIWINKVLHDNNKPQILVLDHISGYLEVIFLIFLYFQLLFIKQQEILITLANQEGNVYQNIDQSEILQIQKISGQGYLSTSTLMQVNGVYNLTQLANIQGNFGQNLTLQIYSNSIKVPIFDPFTGQVTYKRGYSVILQINMIQKCPIGYVSKKNILNYDICILCEGSYSFDPDSQVCTPCPVEKAICYGSFIQLPKGYWRSSSNSSVYYQCETDFIKCVGENSTLFQQISQFKQKNTYEVFYCNRGYIGALCGDCDINQVYWDSKFYKTSYNSCKQFFDYPIFKAVLLFYYLHDHDNWMLCHLNVALDPKKKQTKAQQECWDILIGKCVNLTLDKYIGISFDGVCVDFNNQFDLPIQKCFSTQLIKTCISPSNKQCVILQNNTTYTGVEKMTQKCLSLGNFISLNQEISYLVDFYCLKSQIFFSQMKKIESNECRMENYFCTEIEENLDIIGKKPNGECIMIKKDKYYLLKEKAKSNCAKGCLYIGQNNQEECKSMNDQDAAGIVDEFICVLQKEVILIKFGLKCFSGYCLRKIFNQNSQEIATNCLKFGSSILSLARNFQNHCLNLQTQGAHECFLQDNICFDKKNQSCIQLDHTTQKLNLCRDEDGNCVQLKSQMHRSLDFKCIYTKMNPFRNMQASCDTSIQQNCYDKIFQQCAQISDQNRYQAGKLQSGDCAIQGENYLQNDLLFCSSWRCKYNNTQNNILYNSCNSLGQLFFGIDTNGFCLQLGQGKAKKCMKGLYCINQTTQACQQLSSAQDDNALARQANTQLCLSQIQVTQFGDMIETCVQGYCIQTDLSTGKQFCLQTGKTTNLCVDSQGYCISISNEKCYQCPKDYCFFSNQNRCLTGQDTIQFIGQGNCANIVNQYGFCQIVSIQIQNQNKYDLCSDVNGICQLTVNNQYSCLQCPQQYYYNPGVLKCYTMDKANEEFQNSKNLIFGLNIQYIQDDCYDSDNCLSDSSKKCPNGCFSCTSQAYCTQCVEGYFLQQFSSNTQQLCIQCPSIEVNFGYTKYQCIDCSSELDFWTQDKIYKNCRSFNIFVGYFFQKSQLLGLQQLDEYNFSYNITFNQQNQVSILKQTQCPQNCISCQIQGDKNICLKCNLNFFLANQACQECPTGCLTCDYATFKTGSLAVLKSQLTQQQLQSDQYKNAQWSVICLSCPQGYLVFYDLSGCTSCGFNCTSCVYKNAYGMINNQIQNLVKMSQDDIKNLNISIVCISCSLSTYIPDQIGPDCVQQLSDCVYSTFALQNNDTETRFIAQNPLIQFYFDYQSKIQTCVQCSHLQVLQQKSDSIQKLCYDNLDNDPCNIYFVPNQIMFVYDIQNNQCLSSLCKYHIFNCKQCFTYISSGQNIYQCTSCVQPNYIPSINGCISCPTGCATCYEGSMNFNLTYSLTSGSYQLLSLQDRIEYQQGFDYQLFCTSCLQGFYLDLNSQKCIKITCGQFCSNCQLINNQPTCTQCNYTAFSNLIKDYRYWIARLYQGQYMELDISQFVIVNQNKTDCIICPYLCGSCVNVQDPSINPLFVYQSQCLSCKKQIPNPQSSISNYQITYDKSRRKCYLCNQENQGCHYKKSKLIYARCQETSSGIGDGSQGSPLNMNMLNNINLDKIILNELEFNQMVIYYNELQIKEINIDIVFVDQQCLQLNEIKFFTQIGEYIFSIERLTLNITTTKLLTNQTYLFQQSSIMNIIGFNAVSIQGINFVQQKPDSQFGINLFSNNFNTVYFKSVSFEQLSTNKIPNMFYLAFTKIYNITITFENIIFSSIFIQGANSLISIDQTQAQMQIMTFSIQNCTFDQITLQNSALISFNMQNSYLNTSSINLTNSLIQNIVQILILSNIINVKEIIISNNYIQNYVFFSLTNPLQKNSINVSSFSSVFFSTNVINGQENILFQNDATIILQISFIDIVIQSNYVQNNNYANNLLYLQYVQYTTFYNVTFKDNLNLCFVELSQIYNVEIDTLQFSLAHIENNSVGILQISALNNIEIKNVQIFNAKLLQIPIKIDLQYQKNIQNQTVINFTNFTINNITLIASNQATSITLIQIMTNMVTYISLDQIKFQVADLQSRISYFQIQNVPLQDTQKQGGLAYIQSINSDFVKSNFYNAQANNGAALYFELNELSQINIQGCQFINNTSLVQSTFESFGGAIYFDGTKSRGYDIKINQTIFQMNFASYRGGALYLQSSLRYGGSLIIINSQFIDNFSFQGGLIYKSSKEVGNTKVVMQNITQLSFVLNLRKKMLILQNILAQQIQYQSTQTSIIQLNSVGYFELLESNLRFIYDMPQQIQNTQLNQFIFQNIIITNQVKEFYCFKSTFADSIYGQAIISINQASYVQFSYTQIQNNKNYYEHLVVKQKITDDSQNLVFIQSQSINIIYSNIADNQCSICSKGNFLLDSMILNLKFTNFLRNIAFSGGALYIQNSQQNQQNQILISNDKPNNMRYLQQNYFQIFNPNQFNTIVTDCAFQDNFSFKNGGALYLKSFPTLICFTKFTNNTAKQNGGAIYSDDNINSQFESLESTYEINQAQNGGGIYSKQGNSIIQLQKNRFYQNIAHLINSDIYSSPTQMIAIVDKNIYQNSDKQILFSIDNHFSGVLNKIAIIQLVNNEGEVYTEFENDPLLYLTVIKGKVSLSASFLSQKKGIFNFTEQVSIFGYFGEKYLLMITSDSIKIPIGQTQGDQIIYQTNYQRIIEINMIQICNQGYIPRKNNQGYDLCIQCPKGTYSLDPTQSICQQCPLVEANCYGNIIELPQGYWRSTKNSINIYPCSQNFLKCIGDNNGLSQSLDKFRKTQSVVIYYCNRGYLGAICDDCDYNSKYWNTKFYKTSYNSCNQCRESEFINTIIYLVLFLIYVALLCYYSTQILEGVQQTLFLNVLKYINPRLRSQSNIPNLYLWLKLILNYIQIISYILDLSGNSYGSFYFINFFKYPFIVPIDELSCIFNKLFINFKIPFQQLLYYFSSCIVMIFACFLVFKALAVLKKQQSQIYLLLVQVCFIIFYFNIQFFIQTGIQTLSCIDYDGTYYVSNNTSLECTTQYFIQAFIYASIVFFLSLVPIITAQFMLYKKKLQLNKFKYKKYLGFFSITFDQNYYYWDLIILAEKSFLITFSELFKDNKNCQLSLMNTILMAYTLLQKQN